MLTSAGAPTGLATEPGEKYNQRCSQADEKTATQSGKLAAEKKPRPKARLCC